MLKNELNLDEKFFFSCLNKSESNTSSVVHSGGQEAGPTSSNGYFNKNKLVHARGVKLDATSLSSLSSASSSPASSPPSFLHQVSSLSSSAGIHSMPSTSSSGAHSNSYLCKDCFRTFKDVNNFKEHRFQEHHIREYPNVKKCKLCSYATLLKSKYDCHMRCHLNNKIIRCQKCDYSTINIRHMSRHERMHMISMSSSSSSSQMTNNNNKSTVHSENKQLATPSKFINKRFKSNSNEMTNTSNNNSDTSYTSLNSSQQSDMNRQNLELITRAIMTNNTMSSGGVNTTNPLGSLLLAARVTDFNVLMQQQQQQESDKLLSNSINAEFRKNMLNILAALMPQYVANSSNKSQLDEMIDYMSSNNNLNSST